MYVLIIGLAAAIATIIGGLFAIKFRDSLHLVLGFSAGAVIGVAFFDLLPEAISISGSEATMATSLSALGFIIYMVLDRLFIFHTHTPEDAEQHTHESKPHTASVVRSQLGAGSLSVHSFLDGVAIGLAFQVSSAVGLIVAIAVLVHDFSDGINTVSIILKQNGQNKRAFRWLIIDALAPILGVASTFFFHLSGRTLAIILALFSGFFLYIGASDLLPESHHRHPTLWTTFMTIVGISILFVAIKLAHL